jgi:penicillin-binding protein 1A
MVGGTDFAKSQVNLAVGRDGGGSGRQPGSSFKPFALAEAVKEGYSVRSLFKAPSQIVFPHANAGRDWKVKNYAGTDEGILDLVDATRVSSNTVYAQLMLDLGADKVVGLAERMGITAALPAVPSLVLGSGEVSVLDMASAYSTFANRGEHVDPVVVTRIERADGTVLVDLTPDRTRVLEPDQADVVTYCLRQVIQDGTGKGANFGRPAAGKTGTTEDNRDAWFVGYTPKLTAAVWMGYPGKPGERPRYMSSVHGKAVTGGSFPADIWRKFMRAATSGIDTGSFTSPRNLDGGVRLNKDLQTTTSTTSTSSTTTSTSSTTSTTAPPSTTAPKPPAPTTTTAKPPPSTTSSTAPPSTTTTSSPGPLPSPRTCSAGPPPPAASGRLVGVVGAAREAPALDLVEHLHLALGVPALRRDVEAVDRDEVVAGGSAAVAGVGHDGAPYPAWLASPVGG